MDWGGSVHCVQHSDVRFYNRTRAIFQKAVNTKLERLECICKCLVQQLTFHSIHFYPASFTRPSCLIFQGSGSETSNKGNEVQVMLHYHGNQT